MRKFIAMSGRAVLVPGYRLEGVRAMPITRVLSGAFACGLEHAAIELTAVKTATNRGTSFLGLT
jgi:hypothetical protein